MEQHLLPSGSQQLQPAASIPQQKSLIGVRTHQSGKFMASITICGHSLQLGVCDSTAQAVKAHDLTALALLGPDAATNFPAEHYSPQDVEATRQLLLREQQQSQATISCSPCSLTEVNTAAAAGTAAAGQDTVQARGNGTPTPAGIAADAQAIVQPAVGSKRARQLSSGSQGTAIAALAAADSRCLQEQPVEELQQDDNPSCKRHKLTPCADLSQSTDGTVDHATAQQQQQHQQQQKSQSSLPETPLAASRRDRLQQQQQTSKIHQISAETVAVAAGAQLQQGSRGSTAKLLPEASGPTTATQQPEWLAGMQPAAAVVESFAAGVGTGGGQQHMHAAFAAACRPQQQRGVAGFGSPENPGMLNSLLCLIEAAASLPAEEQAALLPAHVRNSNPVSSSAAQQQQQQQEEEAYIAAETRQSSVMLGQQLASSAGHVPASVAWPGRAAEQGNLLQVPASSQQPRASQRPVQPAVQGQQTFPSHQAAQKQQQPPSRQFAGELDAMQFLQTNAGKLAVQRLTQQFQQQRQVHDWQEFLQSASAQQSLLSLQQLYNQTAGTAVQQQQQRQQLPTLPPGFHRSASSSRLPPAAPSLPGQQQMFYRLFPLPAGMSTAAAAAAAASPGQQLGHTQRQQQQQVRLSTPGQPGSNITHLQLALSTGTDAHPAAAAAAGPAASAAAAARRLQCVQQQQTEQAAAAAHLKPRRSEEGTCTHLLSRGSSGHSDGSTYRSSRSPSPDADDDAAAAAAAVAAAGDMVGRGRSVSADSGRGAAAAAAAGANALAAVHAAAAARMFGAAGAYAEDADAYAGAGAGNEEGCGGAAAAFEMLLGGGTGKRHSARPKRPTERMQEMQQQMREQHKQRNPRQQQEQQQCDDQQQLLQDLWAMFGRAGLPVQFEQQQQEQYEQPPVQRRQQQQQLKKKRVNIAWKPPGGKAGAAAAGGAGRAAAAAAGGAGGDDAAAAADGGEVPAPIMKVTGPGCVSHAQNPTGQMGVRMRKNRYEAFIAVPPFRYLYLGQHTTAADAVRTRDTAMLAIYGPEAAVAHGAAWLSPGVAGSIEARDVAAMAAKLVKKEQVAGVMKQHGTNRVVLQAGTAGGAADGAGAAAQE